MVHIGRGIVTAAFSLLSLATHILRRDDAVLDSGRLEQSVGHQTGAPVDTKYLVVGGGIAGMSAV